MKNPHQGRSAMGSKKATYPKVDGLVEHTMVLRGYSIADISRLRYPFLAATRG